MARPIKLLKNLWRIKHNKIKQLEAKQEIESSEHNTMSREIVSLKRELFELEDEMYGDWAPKAVRDDG
jgi:hypothetical protein